MNVAWQTDTHKEYLAKNLINSNKYVMFFQLYIDLNEFEMQTQAETHKSIQTIFFYYGH
jgi:hypothetical protein